jgi:hypothetical protein
MNDYWKKAVGTISKEDLRIVSRINYDISWPADPWNPVKIISGGNR